MLGERDQRTASDVLKRNFAPSVLIGRDFVFGVAGVTEELGRCGSIGSMSPPIGLDRASLHDQGFCGTMLGQGRIVGMESGTIVNKKIFRAGGQHVQMNASEQQPPSLRNAQDVLRL